MGAQASSEVDIKQSIKTAINNTSVYNENRKTINKSTSSETTNQVNNCSQSTLTDQDITLKGLHLKKGLTLNVTQDTKVRAQYSCVQTTTVKNTIATKIATKITTDLKNKYDNTVLNKMVADAVANAKAAGLFAGAHSGVKVDQETDTKLNNYSITNIKDFVENIVTANISTDIYDTCVQNTTNSQKVTLLDLIVDGATDLTINQSIDDKVFASCVQKSQITNNILNDLAVIGGIMKKDEFKNSVKNADKAKAKADAAATGPFAEFFKQFGKIFGQFASIAKWLGIGAGVLSLSSCCLIIFIVVIFLILHFKNHE